MKIGDVVYIEPARGFCTGGEAAVTDVLQRYDEVTGKPYDVICFGDHWFDGRTGHAKTEPYAYYINIR